MPRILRSSIQRKKSQWKITKESINNLLPKQIAPNEKLHKREFMAFLDLMPTTYPDEVKSLVVLFDRSDIKQRKRKLNEKLNNNAFKYHRKKKCCFGKEDKIDKTNAKFI